MSDHTPNVGAPWKIAGCLRDTEYPELLNGAMIELTRPGSDILIYGGWDPEEDVNGEYVIGALRGCDSAFLPYRTRQLAEAISVLERLAHHFLSPELFSDLSRVFEMEPANQEAE